MILSNTLDKSLREVFNLFTAHFKICRFPFSLSHEI